MTVGDLEVRLGTATKCYNPLETDVLTSTDPTTTDAFDFVADTELKNRAPISTFRRNQWSMNT